MIMALVKLGKQKFINVGLRVRNCSKLKDIKSLTHKIKYKNNDYDIVYINDTNKDFWDFKCEVLL